jgi:predicted DNA-binding transcriptional regulator AlpA
MTRIPKLAGLAEVAGLAGVTRQRAYQLTKVKTFPDPAQVLAATPVWLESDVVAFLGTPRAPGRPRLRTLNPETH